VSVLKLAFVPIQNAGRHNPPRNSSTEEYATGRDFLKNWEKTGPGPSEQVRNPPFIYVAKSKVK